ncbi:exosortase A [Psychrobium sp. 1_MG-2023]|uniref:exosortase A n=1 Tax=Psychrobium sp. 1_MG-2023 TaxID=3062624 RepID=UPI0026A64447|nr:exosortase A [Psychrobium sp. 1_MG-2023]MDP2561127.1 exosortase A [Psychrobium sp. 1_MG-2023]
MTQMAQINLGEKQQSKKLAHCFLLGGLTFFIWFLLFLPVIKETVSIWLRSDTFAHGMLILPVVAWLFWQQKPRFYALEIRPSKSACAALVGLLLLYMTADLLSIDAMRQLAVFALLSVSLWLVFGDSFARSFKFPLCYILFAVPIGHTLIPWLQVLTAKITVYFLQVSQIPVYFEGLYITTPNGVFEVAVACSGIRYLLSTVAVGTLYAYLTYRSVRKQCLFAIFAVLMPLIANGIRAYLIVLIAHHSEMKYATGADHLIYGWLFFGLIIFVMFYVGGFWADHEKAKEQSKSFLNPVTDFRLAKYSYGLPIICLIALLLSTYLVRNVVMKTPPKIAAVMVKPDGMEGIVSDDLKYWGINFRHPLSLLKGRSDNGVEIHIAQYANKQSQGKLITSTNVIYHPNLWSLEKKETKEIQLANGKIPYVELSLVRANGQRRTIFYWYHIDGINNNNKSWVKLNQGINLLLNNEVAGYFIAISAVDDFTQQAPQKLMSWLQVNGEKIRFE